jgi:hypothetical protein
MMMKNIHKPRRRSMARVTGVGKGPEFPEGEEPKVSSKLAKSVADTQKAAADTWMITGYADLQGRVSKGPVEGDRLNA